MSDAERDREAVARMFGAEVLQLGKRAIEALFACARATGISPSKLYMARPDDGDEQLGGIFFVLATKMSDQDMRRFSELFMAFLQDLSTEPGVQLKKEVVLDRLPKGDDAG